MGFTGRDAELVAQAVAAGRWVPLSDVGTALPAAAPKAAPAPRKRAAKRPAKLVRAAVRVEGDAVVFLVPLRVYAGDNLGGGMSKARIGRAGHERKAVAAVLARDLRRLARLVDCLNRGDPVRIVLTRLGGRTMDAANVVAAMKYAQDTAALFLGRDDADPLLRWSYDQIPGGAYGVRIRLEKA